MSDILCKKCGGLHLGGERHRCPPAWRVRIPEWNGKDVMMVHGWSAASAAEGAVQEADEASELGEGSVEVFVWENDEWVRFNVTSHVEINYSATRSDGQ